ncbi:MULTISPECIES: DUF3429 domain-containing protein [unclassified Sulfitobacter]|uniref:DUF3429 domain-containing protein n=1 Tax=unclassified Sulfitobacter TaxID=196795 RepID=UPI0007C274E6|nr:MULTISPECIES: DUF3429 domain-containing protein [unclassified Sulfitobacter]KZY03175.1 hypothetical protein A3721_03665 [Sulfitobacter sp. HI0023]KZY25435.1 hypothetical protein A3728_03625 [Sulfitobacter sp. HI0040]KZZ69814.1 hypothetical protein A3764_01345 [Sulfitobacter sp. HI0129]
MKGIPSGALTLGLAGLIPFFWGALLILGLDAGRLPLPAALQGDGRLVLLRYGGIILPFMSGVLWGFATKTTGARATMGYALSVLPALWWFFAPGTGPVSALTSLLSGFVALLLLDYAFWRWGLAPRWWMSLRLLLTAGVVLSLGVGILA